MTTSFVSNNESSTTTSNDDYFSYNVTTFVTSIAMTFVCLLGFYGNTVSVLIFSRPSMRSSINVLLCGISVIDLAVLFSAFPVFILPSFDQYLKFQFVNNFYSFSLLVVYPLAMMARTSSVWTFVLISIERYFAVCYPFEVNKIITFGRARLAQITIIVLAIFYNIIRFWEYRPNPEYPLRRSADQVVPLLRSNSRYFFIYYTILYLITNFLAPFCVIIILNVHILRTINKAAEERRRMDGRGRCNQHRTSHMIIMVTVMFGVCNVFSFVLSIWESSEPTLFDGDNAESAYVLLDISNIGVLFGSSATFIVFLIYCEKYRRYFFWYFWCRCWSSDPNVIDAINYRPVRHHSVTGSVQFRPIVLKMNSQSATIVEEEIINSPRSP